MLERELLPTGLPWKPTMQPFVAKHRNPGRRRELRLYLCYSPALQVWSAHSYMPRCKSKMIWTIEAVFLVQE
jgi:hypothetical protein